MKAQLKRWRWAGGLLLALAALAAATYWDLLADPDQVLAFNDLNVEVALSPSYRFPEIFMRSWDNQLFFGFGNRQVAIATGFIGDTLAPIFWRRGGQAFVLALCGLAFYWMLRQYRLSRGACALSAAILILTGWCHNFAMAGQVWRPICLGWSALALGFLERGRRHTAAGAPHAVQAWLSYALAGGCMGLCVAEWPDVGLVLAIASAFVFWFSHGALYIAQRHSDTRPNPVAASNPAARRLTLPAIAAKFALYVAMSVLLAWQTISVIFATNIQGVKQGGSSDPAARYAWATQWSVPPAETWNIVSGNYFGSSTRSETHPYWGRVGREAHWETTRQGYRNFSGCGWHLGVIPCILLLGLFILLLIRRNDSRWYVHAGDRRAADQPPGLRTGPADDAPSATDPRALVLMIFIGCTLSLMMMWGKYFPLYRLFWSLPYFDTFRNPEKWNGPFTLLAGLGIALMLDLLWRNLARTAETHMPARKAKLAEPSFLPALRNALLISAGILGGLGLLILLGTFSDRTAFINHLVDEGYGAASEIAWSGALAACVKVVLLSAAFGGILFWLLWPKAPAADGGRPAVSRGPWALGFGLLALLTLGDLFLNDRPFVLGHKYKQYLAPNPLTDYLDAHRTEGRIKLLPPRHPLLNSLRLTLLTIKGYDLFEPVAVSRMPTDYEALFGALEKQPVRLWELGALRYFLTLPGAEKELNALDGTRGRFVERLALGISVVNEAYLPVANAPPEQQHLRVLEFTGALPTYRVVGNVSSVPAGARGDEQALQRLADPAFDPVAQAILHDGPPPESLAAAPPAAITVQEETIVDTRLRVQLEQPGLLVRATKYDPDWQVRLDGRSAALRRVNYLFQGVLLPAGTHTLTFSYQPALTGLYIALLSHGGLLLLLGLYLRCERKTRA